MNLLDKYIDWRLRRAQSIIEKVNPAGALTVINSSGGESEQSWDSDTEAHLKVYLVNVYAYAAIQAIATDVSSTPMLVQKKTIIGGQEQWETQSDGELFELINNPNPNETWDELVEREIISLLAAGNSYLMYDTDDREFYYVKPDWVKVITDAMGRVTQYVFTNRGITNQLDTAEVIHFRIANPIGDFYGMPPSEVIKKTIMTDINLDNYINNYFKNNAMTGTVFSTAQALNKDDIKKIKKQVRVAYTGANQFQNVVLEKGATLSRLSHSLKDLIPEEIDLRVMRKTLAAYKVPPIKIGVLDGASYANANKQDEVYQHGAVEPYRRKYENAVNLQFVRPTFGDKFRVKFDRSQVTGLQEDANEKSKRILDQWKSKARKLNETRVELGLEPVDDDEGGNEFFTSPAAIQFNPADEDKKSRERLYDPVTYKLTKAGEETQRERHEGRLKKEEKKFSKIITSYFNGQVNRLIKNLNDITGKGQFMSTLALQVKADFDENDNLPGRLFNMDAENKLLISDVGISIKQSVEAGGNAAVSDFNLAMDFNPNDPGVQMMSLNFAQKITDINKYSQQQVQYLLIESVKNGDSVPVVSSQLKELYSGWSDKKLETPRAMRIARTEMNGFVNGGASEAYSQGGLGKEWLATFDSETRPEHAEANGQRVQPKEKFMVGGDMLDYPADPNGSPENIINCRCTMIPVVIE